MRLVLALLSSSLLVTVGAAGAVAQTPPVASSDGRIEALKPGEYLWAPDIAPAGPVTIIVSLKTQKAYAYRNGVAIGVSTVSTGTKGHATPTGVFTVLQKDADHVSNIYDDAPMPFMQRLTWGGIAMHGGNLPGYPASHGCIRLPIAFANAASFIRSGMRSAILNSFGIATRRHDARRQRLTSGNPRPPAASENT